jgi:hypothetical protein
MKAGLILECGRGGPDEQVCIYLIRRIAPDIELTCAALDNNISWRGVLQRQRDYWKMAVSELSLSGISSHRGGNQGKRRAEDMTG